MLHSTLRLFSLLPTLVLFSACQKEAGSTPQVQVQVSTLAGTGEASFMDGPATQARLSAQGVAVDAAGTVYVADTNHDRIRQITPAGLVSTLAGSSARGSQDGTGADARFHQPRSVAVNAQGTVYVADQGNHCIRTVSPAGVVRTLAGSGRPGFADGPGSAAAFNTPSELALDAQGNVYVADTYNHRIRKITPAGVVSTLVATAEGGGFEPNPATPAPKGRFAGLAVTKEGTLYIADNLFHRIRQLSAAGRMSSLAGTGQAGWVDGPGASAQFSSPFSLAADAQGRLYVADFVNSRIRLVTVQ